MIPQPVTNETHESAKQLRALIKADRPCPEIIEEAEHLLTSMGYPMGVYRDKEK